MNPKKSHQKKTEPPRVPYQYKPDGVTYEEWQIALRRQFALEQRYKIKNIGDHPVYSDFEISGTESKQTYKVAIRGAESANFYTCPDFTMNTLGTCKHVEYVLQYLKKKKETAKLFHEAYVQSYSSVFLRYGKERQIILHGGVPSKNRKELLTDFHEKTETRVFLSTDAGSVGLNLQCASVLINLDCPWNPAVLEQRIGRVHRMGQKQPVTVINFISTGTIEEVIQTTLQFKKSVFAGVLDNGADEVLMGESKFRQFIKTVEAVVAPEQERHDISSPADTATPSSTPASAQPVKIGESGTATVPALQEFVTLGLNFFSQLEHQLTDNPRGEESSANSLFNIETDKNTGQSSLKISLPKKETLEKVAGILSSLAAGLKE